MKLITRIATFIVLSCSFAIQAQAQTNAPLSTNAPIPYPTQQSFLSTVEGYFTTFNTPLENTFSTNQPYEAWAGASYQSGVFLGGTMGEEGQPFSGKAHGLTLRAVETLAPVVGTLADAEFDIGWSIVYIDTRTTIFAGCLLENKDTTTDTVEKVRPDFGIQFQKALTQNTFAGIYAEYATSGGITVGLQTGFTF